MAFASGAGRVLTFQKDRRKQADGHVRHAIDDFTKELKPLGIDAVSDRQMDFFTFPGGDRDVRVLLRPKQHRRK
jgi:hypothetical protein